ncbi:hypothetical protein Leryth_002512 [Lithospermum erythrorhizon]|nr:hypothetical protein Leryth_002512 [Lithospermum erythrorhizon]
MEREASSSSAPAGCGGLGVAAEGGGAAAAEKRRRGRPKRQAGVAPPKPPPLKRQAVVVMKPEPVKEEEDVWEDVCFICFDGGSLVLCDRKGCPKAYHPACIKRDEAYFQSKGKWNCGWHICSVCQKASRYMCYTCTYSLCKGCIKETDFVCVRGNMGLCTTCMKTIMLIENKDQANKESVQVDFDDVTSWEYLFKVYWTYLKQSISLTLHELTHAKSLSQGVRSVACNQKLHDSRGVNGTNGVITNGHCEHPKDLEQTSSSLKNSARCKEWASKELLEFVAHVKNGDTSVLSQFDVQELLLKYINTNGLLDRDCQIICDLRLSNLFGKPRVSRSEMHNLLACHLRIKEDLQKNSSTTSGIVGTASSHLDHSENKANSTRQQNSCKKFDVGVPQNNLDEYAAIDSHNMNLIYLPRNLMGSLIQDENFHEKVVGSIVRIRISNSDQKQDMYRLVQVRGTSKGQEPYKLGNKTVDAVLEVLNLDKKESIAIDAISDQEFSPDECRHLREIIKCGLLKPFTVGEVRKKAMELLAVRLDERLDAEILKLNQHCDQTSEKERIKELRVRITKLQLLKTPEECQRRFSGIIQVHADPKMSPDYDSEQDAEGGDPKPEVHIRFKSSEFSRSDGKHNSSQSEVKDEELISGQHKVNRKRDECDLSDQAVSRLVTENSAVEHETESSSPMNESETEKMWYYRDPNDKIQGPFSIVQLREWSTTGYFPPDMKIWTIYEHEDSILLTEALNGQFHTAAHLLYNFSLKSHQVRVSNRMLDTGSNENKDKLSRGDNQVDGTLKAGTGGVQCGESYETGGRDLGANSGVQSCENNESGRTDVLGGTSGIKSRENNESGKTDVMVDTGFQSREHNEPVRTDVSMSESSGFTASGFSPKERQPRNSPLHELKEHNSSSVHSQIRQPPSSTNGPSHVSLPQRGGRGSKGPRSSHKHEKKESDVSAAIQVVGQSHENKSHGKSNESQSLGQNRRSFPINLNSNAIDLNSGLSPATNSDSSKQSCDMEPPELPNRAQKAGNREPETEAAENSRLSLDVHPSGLPDPPSPMLKLSNESQVAHVTEYKQPPSLKVEQDLHPSRSSASSLVVGGAQFQDIANDWGGYPPPSMKPVLEGWSSGLASSSVKQHDIAGVHATTTANVDPLAHISACNPTPNTSSWHGIVEPIEFISLAEESVSDLLAEVDAMESQSGGLASPTSAMRCEDEMMKFYKSEGFTMEDFSPTHNPGRSDALSSTGDIQLPCHSTATQEPVAASEGYTYDPSKRSSRHSSNSRDREARSADVRLNQRDAGHPGLSLTMSQDINSGIMDSGIMGRAPEHMNLFWGAPAQGINNIGWAANQGTNWGIQNINHGPHNANGGMQWDGQRKYAGERHPGHRDYAPHGGDVGYSRGRPSWNRQPIGGGGGYARSPRGQRVCKFYENGHCRKGASCDYLHP